MSGLTGVVQVSKPETFSSAKTIVLFEKWHYDAESRAGLCACDPPRLRVFIEDSDFGRYVLRVEWCPDVLWHRINTPLFPKPTSIMYRCEACRVGIVIYAGPTKWVKWQLCYGQAGGCESVYGHAHAQALETADAAAAGIEAPGAESKTA